jgi:hypothetical protein
MAPDRTVVQRGEERSLLTAEAKGEYPMKLARLDFTQHPRPPNTNSARGASSTPGAASSVTSRTSTWTTRGPFGSWTSQWGVMGIGKKHHLVPVEAIAEEEPGSSITLTVDRQTVHSAPTLGDPHTAPDEGLQRAARESGAKNSGRWRAWQ